MSFYAKACFNSVTWYTFTFAVCRKRDSNSLISSKSKLKGKVWELSSLHNKNNNNNNNNNNNDNDNDNDNGNDNDDDDDDDDDDDNDNNNNGYSPS